MILRRLWRWMRTLVATAEQVEPGPHHPPDHRGAHRSARRPSPVWAALAVLALFVGLVYLALIVIVRQ